MVEMMTKGLILLDDGTLFVGLAVAKVRFSES
jgi:hypothetical protein